MTWGNRILVVFILFAALIGTLVYQCVKQDVSLVSKDYYEQELRYQDKIDGIKNANALSTVQLSQTGDEIMIRLPKELDDTKIRGEAWFYCAPDALNDRRIPLTVNEDGLVKIKKSQLVKSFYQVKLKWQIGEVKYFNEQNLQVN